MKFEPPRHTKPDDLPDVIPCDRFSIDITKVKDSFSWFVDMAEFLQTTTLTCKDCRNFPCHRNQDPDQRIGFCYEADENG
ncbi:MAG: hypothetical protein GWP10_18635 [Nitrospiraceae bacterium]|nr:hypothetical protein [Nitrospiraceae bacterium]